MALRASASGACVGGQSSVSSHPLFKSNKVLIVCNVTMHFCVLTVFLHGAARGGGGSSVSSHPLLKMFLLQQQLNVCMIKLDYVPCPCV